MKLAGWARQNGVHPKTALHWYTEGKLPVPARKIGQRTILVELPSGTGAGGAVRAGIEARTGNVPEPAGLMGGLGEVSLCPLMRNGSYSCAASETLTAAGGGGGTRTLLLAPFRRLAMNVISTGKNSSHSAVRTAYTLGSVRGSCMLWNVQ